MLVHANFLSFDFSLGAEGQFCPLLQVKGGKRIFSCISEWHAENSLSFIDCPIVLLT